RPLCDFTTLIAAIPRRRPLAPPAFTPATAADLPEIVDCLQRNLRRQQFAPVWDAASLASGQRTADLGIHDFFVWRARGRIVACAALWDQRRFKQVRVTGYSARLSYVRPCANLALRALGRPVLPAPGSTLRLAYLSHVAFDEAVADVVPDL